MRQKRVDLGADAEREEEGECMKTWTRLEEAAKKCNVMIERHRLMKKLAATDQNYRNISPGVNDLGIANALRLRANVKRIMMLHINQSDTPETYTLTSEELQEDAHKDLQTAKMKAGDDGQLRTDIALSLGKLYESSLQYEQACTVYAEALERTDVDLLHARLQAARLKLEETQHDTQPQPEHDLSINAAEREVIKQFFEEHGEDGRIAPAQVSKLTHALGMFPKLRAEEESELLRQLRITPGEEVDEESFVRWMYV